ncbi:hypothetical protein ARMSODRAFT_1019941 [Armillaria solidipes]|uniref:Uncharacterized protein n=1 Tax=Armillaria solidipes TaxID=1076256 RepID=A0A2H3BQQ6_9AGAR|nr:hypothetical protein ARMSODRAFT_1019941 [Armillaria solidipes]
MSLVVGNDGYTTSISGWRSLSVTSARSTGARSTDAKSTGAKSMGQMDTKSTTTTTRMRSNASLEGVASDIDLDPLLSSLAEGTSVDPDPLLPPAIANQSRLVAICQLVNGKSSLDAWVKMGGARDGDSIGIHDLTEEEHRALMECVNKDNLPIPSGCRVTLSTSILIVTCPKPCHEFLSGILRLTSIPGDIESLGPVTVILYGQHTKQPDYSFWDYRNPEIRNAGRKTKARFPTVAIEVANTETENHLHWACALLSATSLGKIKLVIGIKINRNARLDLTGLKVFFWEVVEASTDANEGLPPSDLMDKLIYKDNGNIWRECTPSVGLQDLYCFYSQTSNGKTVFVGASSSGSRRMIEVTDIQDPQIISIWESDLYRKQVSNDHIVWNWRVGDLLDAAKYVDEHAENGSWKEQYADSVKVADMDEIQELQEVRRKHPREEDGIDEADSLNKKPKVGSA